MFKRPQTSAEKAAAISGRVAFEATVVTAADPGAAEDLLPGNARVDSMRVPLTHLGFRDRTLCLLLTAKGRVCAGLTEFTGAAMRACRQGSPSARLTATAQAPAELELRPVVGDPGDPPGATHSGFELGEVELPDLVRSSGWHHERGPTGLGVLLAFGLIVDLQHPAGALQPLFSLQR